MKRIALVAAVLVLAALAVRSCGSRPEGLSPASATGGDGAPADAAASRGGGPSVDTLLADTLPTDVSCEGLERTLLAAAANPSALRDAFGPPGSRASSTEPNRHIPGATDTLTTLRWDGLEVRFRTPPDGEALPVHASIRSAGYLRHPGLGPGAPAEQIGRVLGEPTRRAAGALVYDCGLGASQPVTFHLDGQGRVERVEISFYVD